MHQLLKVFITYLHNNIIRIYYNNYSIELKNNNLLLPFLFQYSTILMSGEEITDLIEYNNRKTKWNTYNSSRRIGFWNKRI